MLNKKLTILRISIASIIGLLLLAWLLIQIPWIQNKLAQQVASAFAKNVGTEVKVGKVGFSLFNSLDINDVLIRDQKKDSLFYAGVVKLRLSDLFFSTTVPTIKYLGLEKVKIHLHRDSPTWNYQFIADYFNKGPKNKNQKIDIKKIDLSHLEFTKDDEWDGNETIFKTANLIVNLNTFSDHLIQIDQVVANKPFYVIQNKTGKHKYLPLTADQNRKKGTLYFNDAHLQILAKNIEIIKGKFWIENGFAKPLTEFDGEHIRMQDLNATIKNFNFSEDTIKAQVDLQLKERSGFHIKQLQTNFRMTPEMMELNNLLLKTNKSIIGPYYAMQYADLVKDFSDYNHRVKMVAHFINAQVATDDIAFFAPAMASFHQQINTSFKFNGTVDDFTANGLSATTQNSFVKGDFSMKGIPDMRNTQISFTNVSAKTSYNDLLNWIPSLSLIKDLQVNKLNNLLFKGEFNGTLYDFVSSATINSPLGDAITKIRLKFPLNEEPNYQGSLQLKHFNVGALVDVKEMDWVNFKGDINGSSFSLAKAKATIVGEIDSLVFNNYTYTNIYTDGLLHKKSYDGSFRIKDPNMNFISNLEIDFNGGTPKFNAVGDLLNINLQPLNFVKNNNVQVTGVLDVNFEGNKIDNFIGYVKFFNGKLKNETTAVKFDSLSLRANFEQGKKLIQLSSDAINASIAGKFDINHLPATIQYFVQAYLPTYIPAPKNTPTNQQFDIVIKTNYFEPYIRIFNKDFSGFNNINFSGAINTINKSIGARANIPYAQWSNYAIKNGILNSVGTKDSLHIYLNAQSANITDSISFIQPAIVVHISNDVSRFTVNATSKSALEQLSLKGTINTYNDGIGIKWAPSFFLLNQKKWDIENGGELSIRKNNTFAKNFKFVQGIQEILLSSNSSNKNGLSLNLKNLILGDLTRLFFSSPRLEGLTNGTVQLNDILDNFTLTSQLSIDQFSFNDELLGASQLNLDYNKATGMVPFNLKIPNAAYNLVAEGSYNIKDEENPLDANLYLYHSKINLVEQFIGGVLKNLDGYADGQIHFGGRIENPYLLGAAQLDKASFTVDYTKVNYFVDKATIQFTNEGIDFGNIQVKDKLGRTAQFKGKILNQGFKHLDYDMEMSSPKIELLNMEAFDNTYFYGKAVGKASMTIKGPEENIKMNIVADVNDSSHIYLPNTTSKETGKSEFIVFKKYGKSALKSADIPSYNLVVDLEVTANNKTQIDLIFDAVSGDVIKAVGNGRIKMRLGNIEPLTMRGKYNIESGKYDFNFQSFIKKPFELIPEAGNYIEWTGDPLNADIHVDAKYTAERVSLNELAGSGNFSNAVRTYRGNVFVTAALRNKLSKPDIKFSFSFPQGSPISSDNEFSQLISRLERDDNEIVKQVSFLIVFNSFAPVSFNNNNTNNAYNATTIGINTISQLLAKEINKSVTGLLNKVTGDKSLRFDIGSSVYNSGNLLDPTESGIAINANKIDRQRVNLKLGRSFLNDKVIVNFGGDLDFNIRSATTIQNGEFQWLPDLNIEFILTRNRKLRAIVFNRNSLDINGSSLGKRNRQGVSISYRKDFDDFIF